ncbi:MAG: metal-sensitive transcriptional regulator [Bacillota bacterium]
MQVTEENRKKIVNRFSRLEGQVRAVRRMIEDGEDCEKIVTLLSAVHSALEGVTKLVVVDFFRECLTEARENDKDQEEAVDRFVDLLLSTKM